MDRIFEYHGNSFVWDDAKAAENLEDHGVTFEEAATVFDDPHETTNPDKLPSGSAPVLDYSPSCISRSRGNSSASSQLGVPAQQRKQFMLNERLKKRLKKGRADTTITMRIPLDVVESLKAVAPMRGFTAYQTLLKSYISEGLRRDEAQFDQHTARKLADALKRRGIDEEVIDEALAEIEHDSMR